MGPLFSILHLVERVALNFQFSPWGGCGPNFLSSALRSGGGKGSGLFSICISGYKGVALIFLFCALGSKGVTLLFCLFGRGGGRVAPISVLYLGEGVALIFYPVYIYIY